MVIYNAYGPLDVPLIGAQVPIENRWKYTIYIYWSKRGQLALAYIVLVTQMEKFTDWSNSFLPFIGRRRKWRKTTNTNLIRPWLHHWPNVFFLPWNEYLSICSPWNSILCVLHGGSHSTMTIHLSDTKICMAPLGDAVTQSSRFFRHCFNWLKMSNGGPLVPHQTPNMDDI